MSSIFDLEDRKKRKLIERTFRLIFHNNNVLVLVGLPENYKKFISSKLGVIIYFKSTIADFTIDGNASNSVTSIDSGAWTYVGSDATYYTFVMQSGGGQGEGPLWQGPA